MIVTLPIGLRKLCTILQIRLPPLTISHFDLIFSIRVIIVLCLNKKEAAYMANTDQESAPLIKKNDRLKDWEINLEDLKPSPECCIYKVPRRFREGNEKAYTPHLVSIGPIHHGRQNLVPMELQKKRCYQEFLRLFSAETLENFKSYIKENEGRIRRCYEFQFLREWKLSKFTDIILYDAVFIFMLFLTDFGKEHIFGKDKDDDFFKHSTLVRVELQTDFMLLENQLPFFVLEDLCKLAFPISPGIPFLELARSYFGAKNPPSSIFIGIEHFTSLIRCRLQGSCAKSKNVGNRNMFSATTLHQAGVKFTSSAVLNGIFLFNGVSYNWCNVCDSKLDCFQFIRGVSGPSKRSLLDVKFEEGVLTLPAIDVEYGTETRFRNLIAFEQCHCPEEAYFCGYIQLLDSLIDTAEDVDLLAKEGIIVNRLGSNVAVANMINNLGVGLVYSTLFYGDIGWKLNKYYKNSWNRRCAILKQVYFNNIWRGTATVAASIVLLLTFSQTIFAILDRVMPLK